MEELDNICQLLKNEYRFIMISSEWYSGCIGHKIVLKSNHASHKFLYARL